MTALREPLFLAATPTYWPRGVECIIDYNNSACVLNDLRRADQVVVTAIGGLGGPDLNAGAEKNPGRDGEFPQDATYGGRTITLRGFVRSGSVDGMRKLFSYVLDGFDTVAEAPLWMRWLDWRDPFVDSSALVDYAYDAGTGTVTIATDGAGLQPTSTVNKAIRLLPLKNDGTSPSRFTYGDGEAIVKFKAGTAMTGVVAGVELRRASSTVKLRVIYEKATDTLRIYKINAGTTQLATVAATTLVVGTNYWIRVRAEGAVITTSLWTTYPPDTGTVGQLATLTHTLSGGDQAIFPASTSGQGWLLYWTPNSTTDRIGLFDVGAINPGDAIVNCRKAVQIEPGDETQVDYEWRRDFFITLRASDARMVSRKVTKTTITPPSTPVSQIYLSTSLTNLGRSPADMLVKFNATATELWNPRVLLPTVDKRLGVDALVSLSDADHAFYTSLELDTYLRTVLDQSSLSRYSTLSNDTTWPQLQRGTNELRIVADRIDDFRSADASGGFFLNARAAPNLGTWATSGATTDYEFYDLILGTNVNVRRSTTADSAGGQGRIAIINTSFTSATDATVEIMFQHTAFPVTTFATTSKMEFGVIARYVDANNFLRATILNSTSIGMELIVFARVAGVDSVLARFPLGVYSFGDSRVQLNTWYVLSLTVRTNGRYAVALYDAVTGALLQGSDRAYGENSIDDAAFTTYPLTSSLLAPAGALQTGKVGFLDKNSSGVASSRYYTRFSVTSAINTGTVDISYRHSSR